jgi:ATP-dependent protease ClpP protease subunit
LWNEASLRWDSVIGATGLSVSKPFYVVGEITAQIALPFFRDAKRITDVTISSPGGHRAHVWDVRCCAVTSMSTHVVGIAQSASAVLSQAGKWRTITNSSFLMFHGAEEGAAPAHLQLVKQLVEIAKRSGMSVKKVRGLFNNNTFIKADRALELG